jgi:hypothetical protein
MIPIPPAAAARERSCRPRIELARQAEDRRADHAVQRQQRRAPDADVAAV